MSDGGSVLRVWMDEDKAQVIFLLLRDFYDTGSGVSTYSVLR